MQDEMFPNQDLGTSPQAARQAEYEDRKRKAGWKRICVWVPPAKVAKVKALLDEGKRTWG